MLTLGSLFDGIGGWLLAAQHAGIEPIWASEIAPFPASVTAHHFPNVVQLGDITGIQDLPPVDIVTCGSPCQDLSVAGKRKGLSGERSGLFIRAVELVRRLRFATGGQYPRFFVWENVPGAFSSNRGMDFQAVLEEIGESAVPMPEGNRWAPAGLVQFPGAEIAWRVLDAQYWGVPQRRRRIFLVADFTGYSAGEILFERESVPRNIETGGEAREGIAAGAESGTGSASVLRMRSGCAGAGADAGGLGYQVKQMPTLTSAESGTQRPTVAVYGVGCDNGIAGTLDASYYKGQGERQGTERTALVSYTIAGNTIDRQIQNGGNGKGVLEEKSYTLNTVDRHAVATQKTVRRLTPTECERLMGLEDGYTLIDDKSCSDSARYKALGNGMAQPCADYVIRRIVEVMA